MNGKKIQFFPFFMFHALHSLWCNVYSTVREAILIAVNSHSSVSCLIEPGLHRLQTNSGLSQFGFR